MTERAHLLVQRETASERDEAGAQTVDDGAPANPSRVGLGDFATDESEERQTCLRRAILIDESGPGRRRGVSIREKAVPGHDDDLAAVTAVLKLDRRVGHRQAGADDDDAVVGGDGREAFAPLRVSNGSRLRLERGAEGSRKLGREMPEAQSNGVGRDFASVRQA